MSLLEIKNLTTELCTSKGIIRIVDDVSLSLNSGEILGLVGESGCGKSMIAMSVMGLLDKKILRVNGKILFDGTDLLMTDRKIMNSYRGKRISMIFQDVMTSLNPLMKIGEQIMEPLIFHEHMDRVSARVEAVNLLRAVGISSPEKRFNEYPHTLSGGMRQRVMIAIALACRPDILIADEPTTALDVTVQAQILELITQIRDEFGTAMIMISHDAGVISSICDRVAVLYCGAVAEQGAVEQIFENPLHPYTRGLMECIPDLCRKAEELHYIPGTVPPIYKLPEGCRFAERCSLACPECRSGIPPLEEREAGHFVRCWRCGNGR